MKNFITNSNYICKPAQGFQINSVIITVAAILYGSSSSNG